ncbi:MAG: CBS domain-containing protein [Desulfobacterales bacterium]|nr:CBS domain-containing protein [Desulfobacterales bacterium]MBF0395804.1 CBS domain-containing protein [Desulfobacterales bacterium]
MNIIKVKDVMIKLADYATVNEDATLYEAILALEKAQNEFDRSAYQHRAILIFDKNKKIVGKVSQLDIMRALEPKYNEIIGSGSLARFGFSQKFLESMVDQYQLWNNPLYDICRKSGDIKVKDFMYTPSEGEHVEENETLEKAIHQLVIGHHQSLLVTDKNKDIIGILRLSDVFKRICGIIKECKIR